MLGRDSYLVPTLSRIPILRSTGSSGPREGIHAQVGARRESRTSRWTAGLCQGKHFSNTLLEEPPHLRPVIFAEDYLCFH